MTRAAAVALLSHWRRRPGQLLTLILGLALATGLWSAVQAINAQARATYAEAAAQLGTGRAPVLSSPSGFIAQETYILLRRAGWLVTPVIEGQFRVAGESVTVMGVDFLNIPSLPVTEEDDTPLTITQLLTAPGVLLARPETAALLREEDGLPTVVETANVPPGVVLTGIGTAEALLDRYGLFDRLLVLDPQPVGLRPLADLVPELSLAQPDAGGDTARLTDSFHLNLTAFGLLSFAVGLFIVHGTAGLAFEQRRSMVRTLRALGLPTRRLVALVMAELLALAVVGGTLGLVLGYLTAAALLPDVAATLRGLYGAPVEGGLALRPAWFASGLAMALGGAALAGAQGLWQVARLPILQAPGILTRFTASARGARQMALAGLALAALGVLCLWVMQGLVAGFALLAGLLLGAALLLPLVLGTVLGIFARRAQGPVATWVWADMRGQLPGLSLALMALLLALATNVGVGTMVSSFRLTFTGWLDQRLMSELYVSARDDAQGAEMAAWLGGRADAVLPIRYAEARLGGLPGRVYGIVDHPTYRDHWPLIASTPDAWDRVAAGEAALVNEQLARREGLWPGSEVAIAPGWVLPVAGVYSDYGNPSGQAITTLPALLDHFPQVPNQRFGIRIAPGKAPELAAALRDSFDLPADAIVEQAALKAESRAVFEKTFVVTAALNVLTLGVAGFAILTSLLTLWTMRLPQVAPVWALGLTRARLARLELLRSLALAGLTALLALPLGLLLAWVLLAVINVEAFGWRLPMYLFPLDWLRLGALALLAGALAAALPARRLRRLPPSDLLKVFANER